MIAWLFDIDGVITDPTEKRITKPELLEKLSSKLIAGDIVGFNTGRSTDFIIKEVLNPLERSFENKTLLNQVIAIGEKSGVQLTYEDGKQIIHIDESITIPSFIQTHIKTLVESEFSDQMFFDETKKTMVSVEMKDGGDIQLFSEEQKIIHKKLVQLLEKHNVTGLKIDPSTISTDIENESVGKERGVIRFLQILKSRNWNPEKILAFGDSKSDLEMIEPLEAANIPFEFVFVGEGESSKENKNIIYTKSKYTDGTLEYLNSKKS